MNREDPNFWRMASSYLIVSMDGECFIFGVNDLNELDKAVRFFLLTCHLTIWLCWRRDVRIDWLPSYSFRSNRIEIPLLCLSIFIELAHVIVTHLPWRLCRMDANFIWWICRRWPRFYWGGCVESALIFVSISCLSDALQGDKNGHSTTLTCGVRKADGIRRTKEEFRTLHRRNNWPSRAWMTDELNRMYFSHNLFNKMNIWDDLEAYVHAI